MHKICIWRQRESATSHTSSCCWFNPPFGNKIDLQEQFQSETSTFWNHLRGGKTMKQWKCWRWKMWEALVVGRCGPFPLAGDTQLLPVGHLHLLPTFTSTTFHKNNRRLITKLKRQVLWGKNGCTGLCLVGRVFSLPALGSSTPGCGSLHWNLEETESFWFPDYNISLVCFDNLSLK